MKITGGVIRSRTTGRWRSRDDGVITAMKADIYSDGGAFADLSPAVMGRAMPHVDNAYFIPNAAITGTVCRTNYPPNTAFRGFGGPQGMATIENIMEEIAAYLRIDPLDVRMRNCYGIDERNTTPYAQVVRDNHLPQLFDEVTARAEYRRRVKDIRAINAASPTHLRGISCTAVKFGISFNTKFLNQANALVNIYLDGIDSSLDRRDRDGPGREHEDQATRRRRVRNRRRSRQRDGDVDRKEQQHLRHCRLERRGPQRRRGRRRMPQDQAPADAVAAEYFEREQRDGSREHVVFAHGHVFDDAGPINA